MSTLERNTSRKGMAKRPKVEARVILEWLHSLNRPSTIMEVAALAGVSRNTASDRLEELAEGGFLVTKSLSLVPTHGPRPVVFTITSNGIAAVELVRRKRERLATDVDLETQDERFDRAAEKLEREAEEIEAKLAGGPVDDPRQVTIDQVLAGGAA